MRRSLLLLLLVPLVTSVNEVSEVKIAGATTVFLSIVKSNKEAQVAINAVGTTTGSGFAGLQAGQVDIAMPTDTLTGLAEVAAKKVRLSTRLATRSSSSRRPI
jgi:hypothetical protein